MINECISMLYDFKCDGVHIGVYNFIDRKTKHIRGRIVLTEDTIYVNFFATGSIRDILYDANFRKTEYLNKDIKVHKGFYTAYLNCKDSLCHLLEHLTSNIDTENYTLVLTGHSFGATQAVFASMDMLTFSYKFKERHVVLLSSPRVGDDDFVRYYRENVCKYYSFCHIKNRKDIVPHLPPRILGYRSININVEYVDTMHIHTIYKG